MALPRIDLGLGRDEQLPAALLLILFATLCFVGGASREDVLAQAVIRAIAVLLMLIQISVGRLPQLGRYRACVWLLGAMIAVAALQLVPLPPALWTALPGRELVASIPLDAQPWRPLNLMPDAGWNALFSLLVPLCVLVLIASMDSKNIGRVRHLMLGAVVFSALLGLLQAVGIAPDNRLINGSATDYAGTFANRNHQALFLAIGIAIAWFWGFERAGSWRNRRLWFAVCIVSLLAITILVTGSRSGALLGALAVVASVPLAQSRRANGNRLPVVGWIVLALVGVGAVLLLGLYFGRAQSLYRVTNLDWNDELRLRTLPTVWQVIRTYFPFGAGLGTFDSVFRAAEPFSLLRQTYFNHAHDDFAETVIETGIFGPIIILSATFWLVRRTAASLTRGWAGARTGRLGALIVALILIASISDYPARTPMIMAVLAVAGCWLTDTARRREAVCPSDALPAIGKPL